MPELAGTETEIGLYLEVASEIGRATVASAVWHERRCSWIGAWPEETPAGIAVSYRALGPDLYGGTAGIGVFLAELGRAVDDRDLRLCALGALRHAASHADSIDRLTPLGLYGGRPGVALALAYGARLLDEPELAAAAGALARSVSRADGAAAEFDLVSGHAGAIVGLLALAAILGEPDHLESAVAQGDALLRSARADPSGRSWRSPRAAAGEPALAGLSHGAAGAAGALLELAATSGEARFRDAALEAFAYERALFDARVGNWPDLRESAGGLAEGTPTFTTFWCHGAPGIALSRIRALELSARAPGGSSESAPEVARQLRGEAIAALDTTAAWVAAALEVAAVSYSLCHGLAGNAEIVEEGRRLGDPAPRSLARGVASHGIDRYRSADSGWPSGVQGGPTPSLFLGDAGVGRFYLRLARPALPSLLIVRPEAFGASAATTASPGTS